MKKIILRTLIFGVSLFSATTPISAADQFIIPEQNGVKIDASTALRGVMFQQDVDKEQKFFDDLKKCPGWDQEKIMWFIEQPGHSILFEYAVSTVDDMGTQEKK